MRGIYWHPDAWDNYVDNQPQKSFLKKVNALIKDIQRNGFKCVHTANLKCSKVICKVMRASELTKRTGSFFALMICRSVSLNAEVITESIDKKFPLSLLHGRGDFSLFCAGTGLLGLAAFRLGRLHRV